MPREIKQIDLLVHPFFDYVPGEIEKEERDSYGDIEAEIMMEIWKASVDEIARDKSRILVFVGTKINEQIFEKIKKKKLKPPKDEHSVKEFELLKYAHEKLEDRLFFVFDRITKKSILRIYSRRFNPKKVIVEAYGEWTIGCVAGELKTLVLLLKIPKKNAHLKPKKSVDVICGYPRVWNVEKLKKLSKEKRNKEIRKRVKPYLKVRSFFK